MFPDVPLSVLSPPGVQVANLTLLNCQKRPDSWPGIGCDYLPDISRSKAIVCLDFAGSQSMEA
eukprot:scaffold320705_cov36-Prasinocladus_malaysianus.AAC.1